MKKHFLLLSFLILWSATVSAEECIERIDVSRLSSNEPLNTEGDSYVVSALEKLVFTAVSNSVTMFKWTWHNVGTPDLFHTVSNNSNEIILDFDKRDRYVVNVEPLYEEDCESGQKFVQIEIEQPDLRISNLFSPNGDGQHDQFCVKHKSLVKYSCHIYNRWGRLVFSANRPDVCWDGTIGGKPADIGAYYYVIEAEGADGHRYKRGGDINLVR